jgi:hypothetical protein
MFYTLIRILFPQQLAPAQENKALWGLKEQLVRKDHKAPKAIREFILVFLTL